MGPYYNMIERAVVFPCAVVCTLLNRTLNAVVGFTGHGFYLLSERDSFSMPGKQKRKPGISSQY